MAETIGFQKLRLDRLEDAIHSGDHKYEDACFEQVLQAMSKVHEEASQWQSDRGLAYFDENPVALFGECKFRWRARRSSKLDGAVDWNAIDLEITIVGPWSAINELRERYDPSCKRYERPKSFCVLERCIKQVLGYRYHIAGWTIMVGDTNFVAPKEVTNQGRLIDNPRKYESLNFNSASEVSIAKVLDQKHIMYFANCTARVSQGQDRLNREPDFLICHEGKWGILEVDGEPFHPPPVLCMTMTEIAFSSDMASSSFNITTRIGATRNLLRLCRSF